MELFLPISFLIMFLQSASAVWICHFVWGLWAFGRAYRDSWSHVLWWFIPFFCAVLATLIVG